MTVIGVLPASATVESDEDLAPSERSTPDGRTPPGTAGYIVGECTVLCVECGREHDDVHSHPDDTEPHEFDYDYFRTDSEADWPGNTCEGCHRRLPTNVLVYASGPGPDDTDRVRDPDGMGRTAKVYVLERGETEVRVMLREEFRPYGEQGDTTWLPRDHLMND